MPNNSVLYAKKGHVGWITLNRPEARNAVDLDMAQELAEVCQGINQDAEIHVAVITGSGEAFCSGGDEKGLVRWGDSAGLPLKNSPAEAIAGIDRPTIAAINGEALGEGLEIALACDLRIAADKARFGLPQITEGYIPLDGGTQRLSRTVGKGKALEMVLLGEIIDADTAFETGLVNKVVGAENLLAEVENIAGNIASKAPIALKYAKEAVNKGLDVTLEQGLRLEADLYFLIHTTADRTEGIKSFLEKRKPNYQGK